MCSERFVINKRGEKRKLLALAEPCRCSPVGGSTFDRNTKMAFSGDSLRMLKGFIHKIRVALRAEQQAGGGRICRRRRQLQSSLSGVQLQAERVRGGAALRGLT